MRPTPPTTVLVSPAGALAERPRLFAALQQAFPIRFEDWAPGRSDGAGLIAIGPTGSLPASTELPADLPTLAVAGPSATAAAAETFRVHDAAGVDSRVRGVALSDRFAAAPLRGDHGDVLATCGPDAVWTVTRRRAPLHRVRSTLPELAGDEVLYALLSKRQLTAIALVQFLRDMCAPSGWEPAPLRAAFLFDDPNLRWRSYGFIDYERLVAHADEHGYHAAMATIPLDGDRAHRPTAELFNRRADRLSLIVHGNDHTKSELLATDDDATAQRIAAQALRRIRRFEQRSGVAVDRVMAPPHGLCSQAMARALGAVGFDALTAIHPRPWTQKPPTDPLLAGWQPADFVAGCPVVPRIPLGSTAADIALRAFLDHPLIVYGHHEDVAGGLDALAETAATVNRLGDVRWTSIGSIVASNLERRADGALLRIVPFSRRVVVSAGPGVASVTVTPPADAVDAGALRGFSVRGIDDAAPPGRVLDFDAEVTLEPGSAELEIQVHGAVDIEPSRVAPPRWRPWARVRRAGTEIRDRATAKARGGGGRTAGPRPPAAGQEARQWAA